MNPSSSLQKRWLPINGHPLHEVSDCGDVRNINTGKILKGSLFKGYKIVHLSGKDTKNLRVHVLVLEAFVGPRPTQDAHARHLDGDKSNNRLANLAWGSCQENTDDRRRHGRIARGEASGKSKLTASIVAEIRSKFRPIHGMKSKLAREYNVVVSTIDTIVQNKTWRSAEIS